MKFKLKELPKLVDWQELSQFTIIKEDGSELEIRRMDRMSTEGVEYWMLDNGEWKGLEEEDLTIWLSDEYYNQEVELIQKKIDNEMINEEDEDDE